MVDTLRADHTSAYGYERDTTPRLREFAAQGVRFEAAYAPTGLTGPSHATIFTSQLPMRHGVVKNGLALSADATTLAERLSAAGYQTAAVVSSFVLTQKFGFGQGFGFYDDELDPGESTMTTTSWEGHEVSAGFDRRGDHTTRRALEWLEDSRSDTAPFFLFVHYFDPHSPYDAPDEHRQRFIDDDTPFGEVGEFIAEYDAEVHFADAMAGRLLDALDELGLADDTLVIVTADHGEGLMDHGYMLHGVTLYDEELRVPLLMRWPGRIAANSRIEAPVGLVDLTATISELLEIEAFDDKDGVSLAPALLSLEPLDPNRPIHLYRRHFDPALVMPAYLADKFPAIPVSGSHHGLREGRWKYILGAAEKIQALYDLEADPSERHNLAVDEWRQTARFRTLVDRWVAQHGGDRGPMPKVSEADLEKLRALGYTD